MEYHESKFVVEVLDDSTAEFRFWCAYDAHDRALDEADWLAGQCGRTARVLQKFTPAVEVSR